jgi:isopentenyl diphosphate isomerase/L-lactate dehydrogenase-like FMN-dependent dehydrogenase
MSNQWFETVAKAQWRPKKRLPPSVYGALISAISVSDPGGNDLDGIPATIGTVPALAGQVEIVLDGGIRRGGDVVKALASACRPS